MRVAIGLPVPAIEAWLRCGADVHVNELAWQRGLNGQPFPYTKSQLKIAVYKTDRPSLDHETTCMKQEMTRVATDPLHLEHAFPVGFGNLAREIRTWVSP